MKDSGMIMLGVLLLIGASFFIIFQDMSANEQLSSLINSSEQENEQIKLQLTSLQSSVDSLDAQVDNLQEELEQKNEEIECLVNFAIHFARLGYGSKLYAGNRIIIGFFDGFSEKQRIDIIESYNLTVSNLTASRFSTSPNFYVVKVPEGEEVEWVCRTSINKNIKYSNLDFLTP